MALELKSGLWFLFFKAKVIQIIVFEYYSKDDLYYFHFDQKSYLSTSGGKILRFNLYAISELQHMDLTKLLAAAG